MFLRPLKAEREGQISTLLIDLLKIEVYYI